MGVEICFIASKNYVPGAFISANTVYPFFCMIIAAGPADECLGESAEFKVLRNEAAQH